MLALSACLNTAGCLLPPAVKGPEKPTAEYCCEEFARGGENVECHGSILVGKHAEDIRKAVNWIMYNHTTLMGMGSPLADPSMRYCEVGRTGQYNDQYQAPVSVY